MKQDSQNVEIHYSRRRLVNGIEYFHPKGLRWACKRCGACCRDSRLRPRRVLLLSTDVKRLKNAGKSDFSEMVKGEEPFTSIMRKSRDSCIFLTPKGCSVYPSRALLCRTYPFWVEKDGPALVILVDTACPGVGSGPEIGEGFYRGMLEEAATAIVGEP